MNITILITDERHPIHPYLIAWKNQYLSLHNIIIQNDVSEVIGGDILFLVSCHNIVGKELRDKFKKSLVIHASDLPEGRGWSPLVWQIIGGKNNIIVSLLEAEDDVDSGAIVAKKTLKFQGHELFNEINHILFTSEMELMSYAIDELDNLQSINQNHVKSSYYRRRNKEDSEIDVNKSIAEQFEILRVSDPIRYPPFFKYRGHKYILEIKKDDEEGNV